MCSQLQALDHPAMLEAIRLKENTTKRGAAGELGPYQMMPKTVRDAGGYNKLSAAFHLRWLERQLKARGADPSPFNLALCWNAGLERATGGQAKEISYHYARDVERNYRRLIGESRMPQ